MLDDDEKPAYVELVLTDQQIVCAHYLDGPMQGGLTSLDIHAATKSGMAAYVKLLGQDQLSNMRQVLHGMLQATENELEDRNLLGRFTIRVGDPGQHLGRPDSGRPERG